MRCPCRNRQFRDGVSVGKGSRLDRRHRRGGTAAVNEGNIFRFLNKPCPVGALIRAQEASVKQYRLITAERVLLEQTLRGSLKTLTDILAFVNLVAFGRAIRA
jgi:ABC-type uncharacterized transport system permease subunit